MLPPGTPGDGCPFCVDEEEAESGDIQGDVPGDEDRDGSGDHDGDDLHLPTGAGRRLGDFELLHEVARGGMGVVWRGRQRGLDRDVAVKTLPGGDLASAEARARFRIEARATARLRHPNIVPVLATGEQDGLPWLAMEWVSGPTLTAAVASSVVPARQAARWLRDAARAVACAHDHGVLHCDLKPSNILIEPSDDGGRVRITDFGLARLTDSNGGLTKPGTAAGSPAWMAPEQARGQSPAPAVDVYGLGAVLYHTLTSRAPFRGESVAAVLRQVDHDEPMPPRRFSPAIPRDLETICLKCLEKDPALRYGGARELAEDLDRFLEGRPVLARPLPPVQRLQRLALRHPWQAAAGGMLTLLVTGAFAFLIHHAAVERRHLQALGREKAATALALKQSQLGEARARVRLPLPDSRPRVLAKLAPLAAGDLPDSLRAEGRDLAAAALALPAAATAALPGEGVRTDDWTLATGDAPRRRWALSPFRGPVALRGFDSGANTSQIVVSPRVVTALMAFSPGGRWLAVRHEQELGIWETAAGHSAPLTMSVRPWTPGHPFGLMKIAFAPDDRSVTWADHGSVVVSALPGGGELARWVSPDGSPLRAAALAIDSGGRWLAVADAIEPLVHLRQWPDGQMERQLTGLPLPAPAVAVSAGARRIAAGTSEGHLCVWRLDTAEPRRMDLAAAAGAIRTLTFSPDGRLLYSTSEDATTRIHDCDTAETLVVLPLDAGTLTLTPDGKSFGVGCAAGQLSLAGVEWSDYFHHFRHAAPPALYQQIAFAPDGRSIWSLTDHAAVRSAVPGGGELERIPWTAPWSVRALPQPGGGLWIAGRDGLSRRFPAQPATVSRAGEELFPESTWGWSSLTSTPDGRWVAASDNTAMRTALIPLGPDGIVRSGDIRFLSSLPLGTGLALSPDGSQTAVGFRYEAGLKIHDNATGALLRRFDVGPRHSLAWSPDGRWLAACGASHRLWDTETWEAASLPELEANHSPNGGAAFSPPGADGTSRMLALASGDKRIALIELPTRRRLITLEPPAAPACYQLEFSRDGQWLAAATATGAVHLWNLTALQSELEAWGWGW